MAESSADNYKIITVRRGEGYEELRDLWHVTFGDEPGYIDAFYENFGEDIKGYAVTDGSGRVCSALTCHLCGRYMDRPVYVSYAICTREDMRGQGLAGMLTSFVRDEVVSKGGISVVSPAEPSLEGYYAALGYVPHFSVSERAVMAPGFDDEDFFDFDEFDLDMGREDQEPFRAEIDLQPLAPEKYNMYREAFLADRPHIEPSGAMLRLIASESMDGTGLYSINRGDAICAVSHADPVGVVLSELILNPVLQELSLDIDAEIASMTAGYFEAAEAVFRTPGPGRCQGMAAGIPPESEDAEEDEERYYEEPYYGFPIE